MVPFSEFERAWLEAQEDLVRRVCEVYALSPAELDMGYDETAEAHRKVEDDRYAAWRKQQRDRAKRWKTRRRGR